MEEGKFDQNENFLEFLKHNNLLKDDELDPDKF